MRSVGSAVTAFAMLALVPGILILLILVASAIANESRRDASFSSWGAIAIVLIVPGAVVWWRSRQHR